MELQFNPEVTLERAGADWAVVDGSSGRLHYLCGPAPTLVTAVKLWSRLLMAGSSPPMPPCGELAYVASLANPLSVVDPQTGQVVDTINVDLSALALVLTVSPDGSRLWVPVYVGNTVVVVDPDTITVTDTVAVGASPAAAVFSPDGGRVWVINQNDLSVSEIDTAPKIVGAPVTIGLYP